MKRTSIKNTRINGEVQKELSRIISREIKDPRIHPMTSVTQVIVTPVFVSPGMGNRFMKDHWHLLSGLKMM